MKPVQQVHAERNEAIAKMPLAETRMPFWRIVRHLM
jgi:hypothetical protein